MADHQTGVAGGSVILSDPAETEAFAADFSDRLSVGDVVALSGDLGAGKTVFARALIQARARKMGHAVDHVPSPTYTLVQVYELPGGIIHHFDLYRLEDPNDAWELGIEEAFASGISLIEWGERIDGLLPAKTFRLMFEFGDGDSRRVLSILEPLQ